ncbi:hypothetical protein ACFQS1_39265 [Paractinoplanes rhizophilus]|uniref:Uncharacterized protein n=1 Tax=Paractinoplanes rhizophilus TaxID=1416877 RepID=A0ABW2I5B1_9ACTN
MVSDRLQEYVRRSFRADEVETILSLLAGAVHREPGDTVEGNERVQAAVIVSTPNSRG